MTWVATKVELPKTGQNKFHKAMEKIKDEVGETSEHRKNSFGKIFEKGSWGSKSKSGPGSLLSSTVRMREILGKVVERIKIHLKKEKIR